MNQLAAVQICTAVFMRRGAFVRYLPENQVKQGNLGLFGFLQMNGK